MSPYFSPRYYFKNKAKSKKATKRKTDWLGLGLLFVGILLFYAVLFPDSAGQWGKSASSFLLWLCGATRYAVPLILGVTGVNLIKHHKRPGLLRLLIAIGMFWTAAAIFTLLGVSVWAENLGGILGQIAARFLTRLFGEVGSWIIVLGGLTGLGFLIAEVSPGEFIHRIADVLRSEWQDWKKNTISKQNPPKSPVVKPVPSLTPKIASDQIESVQPEVKRSAPEPIIRTSKIEPQKPPKQKEKGVIQKSEPVPQNQGPYESPPLEIFEAPLNKNPVPKEELTSRAKLLEQTLANFNVAANVVEIHPGPVITRYDLSPAPGVKVSSISSRSADLALAMKSIGIRVLAPIPGKGAVGVEIPNLEPEKVGLQELLTKPEYTEHPSPLAFVLGKTVSGEPCIVDLAGLPHLLVAGATGSGKSVVVHSIISSILYRAAPDRVKFVLIDPKRLELPSYTMIPHLYDPCHVPMNAEVITNSKQAAKALGRLVKIMEYRYDQFAKANVRNIDSYNKKREEAGLPPEYYLVVIIDELADLMLTSPKEVEDSIQRLAQMARAVGIHLILATQRPSVDVITGVIKANLPARIALRVASAIDSRVIVDQVGAELLLGKGDMLYLPPASPEPMRVQGAFVSEGEVEKLVDHVKQFGVPSYNDLFSSGSALEFAVEDKKEMKDLIDALRLVLERKRVSQDLLKAHFGSSARATNILSLLEVKEFIRKPEGSNRWEINFDAIEEFLERVNTLPEEEVPA